MNRRELKVWLVTMVVLTVAMFAVSFALAQPASQPLPAPASSSIWTWLAANWQLLLLVYLVPCVLAGLRNRAPGTGLLGFIEAALQWVAVTTPKNSPNTFKLPFTTPKE